MARIYLENLSSEYCHKLAGRELTPETIAGLAASISRQAILRKQVFRKVLVIMPAATLAMVLLSSFSPAAQAADKNALLGAGLFTVAVEFPILAVVYQLSVARVPRQFERYLKQGYPELVSRYGYAQLFDGSLADAGRPTSFYLQIEDTFSLKDREDIIVVGFAHGLINKGSAVYIMDENHHLRGSAIVAAIEKEGQAAVDQAADCHVGMEIRKGAGMGLAKGMFLYRK